MSTFKKTSCVKRSYCPPSTVWFNHYLTWKKEVEQMVIDHAESPERFEMYCNLDLKKNKVSERECQQSCGLATETHTKQALCNKNAVLQ